MAPKKTKKLFLEQVTDRYIRENFRRIEFLLDTQSSTTVVGPTGPQGPKGDTGDPGYTQASGTGSSGGGSVTTGSIDVTQNRAVKFTILAWNVAQNVTRYQELVVLNIDGTTANLKSSSAFRFGSVIDLTVVPQVNAGVVELVITNNELYDIQVEVTQVVLGNV